MSLSVSYKLYVIYMRVRSEGEKMERQQNESDPVKWKCVKLKGLVIDLLALS